MIIIANGNIKHKESNFYFVFWCKTSKCGETGRVWKTIIGTLQSSIRIAVLQQEYKQNKLIILIWFSIQTSLFL